MMFDHAACAEFYRDNGYFVYENALTPTEVEELRKQVAQLVVNLERELRQP